MKRNKGAVRDENTCRQNHHCALAAGLCERTSTNSSVRSPTTHSLHSLIARSTNGAAFVIHHDLVLQRALISVSAPRYGLALPPETMLRENRAAREGEDLSLLNSAAAPGHCQGRTQTQLNAYSQPT